MGIPHAGQMPTSALFGEAQAKYAVHLQNFTFRTAHILHVVTHPWWLLAAVWHVGG
jgi:hypothetical protein